MADCRLTTNLRFCSRRDIRRSVPDAAKLSVKPLCRRDGAHLAVGTLHAAAGAPPPQG